MSSFYTTLLRDHDLSLTAASAMAALAANLVALKTYERMHGARGLVRVAWALLSALVAGAGAWAAHILFLRGYNPTHGLGSSPEGAISSLLLVVATMGVGLYTAAAQPGRSSRIAGGLIIALGLWTMQLVDLLNITSWGRGAVDEASIAAAAVACAMLASAGLIFAEPVRKIERRVAGGVLLALAALATDILGGSSLTLAKDWAPLVSYTLSDDGMVFAGVSVAVLVILGGLGAIIIDTQTNSSALERIRRLADAAYEGILVIRDGRINDANAAFCALAAGDLVAMTGAEIGDYLIFPDGAPDFSAGGAETRLGALLRPLDGSGDIPVEAFCRPMGGEGRAETSGLVVLAIRDLREQRAALEQIQYLAEHDGLTGLPNRHAMQEKLAAAIERAEATEGGLALICVDLDHFKEVNDLHGHLAGDALLVEVGRRLREQVAAPSFAARLGGDEFVLVQVAAPGEQTAAAAAELATQVLASLRGAVTFEGQDLALAASLGVSLFPDDGRTAEALLANADMALYRTKESGRGAYSFFKREMDETIRERRNLARELRQAIADDGLEIFYQPLAKAGSGEICGFEALCRWPHETRGMIPPDQFIPVAEESGLIIQLGEWVLRKACADAASWRNPLRIAVNLSPLQLNQPTLPTLVHEVLIATGLSPQRLELEVTESALFKDYQRALDNLRRLKALGVRIAMDDFGTGFSSLSTLQSFPFDKLKIDKSFVEQIHAQDRAMVIVKAVLGLGRSLGIPVVAEGVETEEQISFLRGESCEELQGYAIGRPARIESMDRWTTDVPVAEMPIAAKPKRRQKAA